MQWHSLSIKETLDRLGVTHNQGLSSKEVKLRQQTYGYNILEATKKKNILFRFLGQFADFMIIILIWLLPFPLSCPIWMGTRFSGSGYHIMYYMINATLGLLQKSRAEKLWKPLRKCLLPPPM
jgi:Ca2+-transporting ATPase